MVISGQGLRKKAATKVAKISKKKSRLMMKPETTRKRVTSCNSFVSIQSEAFARERQALYITTAAANTINAESPTVMYTGHLFPMLQDTVTNPYPTMI